MKDAIKISKAIYVVSALLLVAYISANITEHRAATYLAFASSLLRAGLVLLLAFQFATMVSTLNDRFIKPFVVGLAVILFVLLTESGSPGYYDSWRTTLF